MTRPLPFEDVVQRYGPTVLRVCRAVVGPDVAEDAWSETFIAAMRAYPDLAADSNLEAWLVTIAHRKAIDQARARNRRPIPSDVLAELVADREPDPPFDEHDELWEALAALPEKQRYTVAYHHLIGLSYKEIADLIGGTPAAARRSAADGIGNLRRTYRPWGKGP